MTTKKTLSRLSAVQALYLYEINDRQVSLEQIIEQIDVLLASQNAYSLDSKANTYKMSRSFFLQLLNFTLTNITFIDNIITKNLHETWSLEKIDISLLVILRVGISELYLKTTPFKVVINEFILISKEFLQDKDIGFVNLMLNNISKEVSLNLKD